MIISFRCSIVSDEIGLIAFVELRAVSTAKSCCCPRLVEKSVKGMLPKNKLGADLFRNLTAVVGTEHAHAAQKPAVINLNEFK